MAADTARPNSESRTPVINDDNDIDKKTLYICKAWDTSPEENNVGLLYSWCPSSRSG